MKLNVSDFISYGGFDLSHTGWGEEDVDLVKKLIPKVKLHRANDPDLIHLFHPKFCTKELTQKVYTDCQKSKMSHKGSINYLYKIYQNRTIANIKH